MVNDPLRLGGSSVSGSRVWLRERRRRSDRELDRSMVKDRLRLGVLTVGECEDGLPVAAASASLSCEYTRRSPGDLVDWDCACSFSCRLSDLCDLVLRKSGLSAALPGEVEFASGYS